MTNYVWFKGVRALFMDLMKRALTPLNLLLAQINDADGVYGQSCCSH